ncbi:MAG: hypothetical protein ABWW69_01600 [Pyrodictiaceae archaeon]
MSITVYGHALSRRERTLGELLESLGAYSAEPNHTILVYLVANLAKKDGRPLIHTVRGGEELVRVVLERIAHCSRLKVYH